MSMGVNVGARVRIFLVHPYARHFRRKVKWYHQQDDIQLSEKIILLIILACQHPGFQHLILIIEPRHVN